MLYALYKCIDVREIQKGKSMKRKKSTQLEIDRILEKTNLKEQRYKRFSELSGGMKRRVLFAQALLANPRILILDNGSSS